MNQCPRCGGESLTAGFAHRLGCPERVTLSSRPEPSAVCEKCGHGLIGGCWCVSSRPEREADEGVLARLQWFALTGDLKQWSGPEDSDPLPGMRYDVGELLRVAGFHPASVRTSEPGGADDR